MPQPVIPAAQPRAQRRWLMAALGLFCGLGLTACGGDQPTGDTVTYVGAASDELYMAVADKEGSATSDPNNSAVFDQPADGDAISAGDPVTFSWHLPDNNTDPFTGGCPPGENGAAADAGDGSLGLEHCPLGSGYLYWLLVTDSSGARLANVLSTERSWTPDPTNWASITASPGPVNVKLITVFVEANNVSRGPFLTELSLEVQ